MKFLRLFEDAEKDALYREEARVFCNKLKAWLKDTENHFLVEPLVKSRKYPGGMVIKAEWVDPVYKDLVIILTSQGDDVGNYVSRGGFGMSPDGSLRVIVISDLIRPFDLTYADTRLGAGTFIHEFIHYLDSKRQAKRTSSVSMLRGGDTAAYFNDAGEFNAYFQEMASSLDNFFRFESPLSGHKNFSEFLEWDNFKKLAEKISCEGWQALMSPKYRVKF